MGAAYFMLVALVMLFGGVLLYGAPYLPTLRRQVEAAFELLNLRKGNTLLELGCGDGKVLVAAAQKGYKAVGVELNPLLFVISWLRSLPYRGQVRVIWGDYWRVDWPDSDGVFVFLVDKYMPKLDVKMKNYKKPLASVAFKIPNREIAAQKSGVFLYRY